MLTIEQRKNRINGLGGSEALAYCGKDPRCTPLQLYLRKTNEVSDDSEMNMRQEFGHRLEPIVRDWLSEQLGQNIIVPDKMIVSAEYPFMFANLDGLTDTDIVELKTADKYMAEEFGEVGSDDVPVRYVLQVMHYMLVTGRRRAHIGALIGGNDARHYVVDYDGDLVHMLLHNAIQFWEYVTRRTPPDVQNIEDCKRRWKAIEGKTINASPDIISKVFEYKDLLMQQKILEKNLDEYELQLKYFMGDSTVLLGASEIKPLITWKEQTRTDLNATLLKESAPAIYEQYKRVSKHRVFRVK